MYTTIPLLPLFPFSTYLEPSLLWQDPSTSPLGCSLTDPCIPSFAHLTPPHPKFRPPGVSQTQNRHSLGRHCKPNPYARLQELWMCVWLWLLKWLWTFLTVCIKIFCCHRMKLKKAIGKFGPMVRETVSNVNFYYILLVTFYKDNMSHFFIILLFSILRMKIALYIFESNVSSWLRNLPML